MSGDFLRKVGFTALLAAACAYLIWPNPEKPGFRKGEPFHGIGIVLGIDIQGGAELTYRVLFEADPDKPLLGSKSDLSQKTADAIGRRINIRGLKEPDIRVLGNDRVVLQLAGVTTKEELDEIKKLIDTIGALELLEVADEETHEKHVVVDPKTDTWIWMEGTPKMFHKGEDEETRAPYDYTIFKGADQFKVLVRREPVISGTNFVNATPMADSNIQNAGEWLTSFTLDSDGSMKFSQATGLLKDQKPKGRIAIVMDGTIKAMPVVQAQIIDRGQISGDFSDLAPLGTPSDDLKRRGAEMLGIILKAGELPYPVGSVDPDGAVRRSLPEQETFVGPSLGQDAIRKALWAMGITSLAVALFMILYYRSGGVIAVAALVLNLLFIAASMSLFSATLTLAGLAGLVLTIGMAVDANILIYERMREELDRGKTLLQAFEHGHERAFITILDSNITTFIIGFFLYKLAVGAVQGFAVTLMVGIVMTLVSVLFFGKMLLKAAIGSQVITQMKMMRILANPTINFTRTMAACGVLSLLAVLGSFGFMFSRGGLATADPAVAAGRIVAGGQEGEAVVKITGTLGSAEVTVPAGAERLTVVKLINAAAAKTGVVASPEGSLRSSESGPQEFVQIEFVKDTVDGLSPGRASGGGASPNMGIDFTGGSVLAFTLRFEMEIDEVRAAIKSVKNADGTVRYADASVQTTADPDAPTFSEVSSFKSKSRHFQVRTGRRDVVRIQSDLVQVLPGKLPHPPFEEMAKEEIPADLKLPYIANVPPEAQVPSVGLYAFLDASRATDVPKAIEDIRGLLKESKLVTGTPLGPAVDVTQRDLKDPVVIKVGLIFSRHDTGDSEKLQEVFLAKVRDLLSKKSERVPLSRDPFTYAGFIGPAAARELRDSSLLALLTSSVAMLGYVALRFMRSFRFGAAAVIPLVHDAIIALGVVVLCNAFVPESWGLNFQINMPTVAAILTIIGFSINDTIVLFDRIRENLVLMKHATFADIINVSVNQTLSRTLLTSGTVLMSVLVLFGMTARIGGGVAEFSFPMIVGVLVGSYSTIWVGSYLLQLMYGKDRPKPA